MPKNCPLKMCFIKTKNDFLKMEDAKKPPDTRRTLVFWPFWPPFMIYYIIGIIGFIYHQKTWKIPKKRHSPLMGLAHSDPQCLTPFGFFDPIRLKISTLPPLCFMFICHEQKFITPKRMVSSFSGVAPRLFFIINHLFGPLGSALNQN